MKSSPEHKKKYDEIKALLEADLIGSFERTRNHGIRWKGFSPEGALDNVDLSVPSEERTRALRQEMNYMVAHALQPPCLQPGERARAHGTSRCPGGDQEPVLPVRTNLGESQGRSLALV